MVTLVSFLSFKSLKNHTNPKDLIDSLLAELLYVVMYSIQCFWIHWFEDLIFSPHCIKKLCKRLRIFWECLNNFKLSSVFWQPWTSVSNLAKDFIDRVLTVDPTERLTAGQALKHPWIVSMAASSSMKNLQRSISQNLLKRASSRCHSTKSAQSTRSSRSTKSSKARRVREKELRELNRRYQQQCNGWEVTWLCDKQDLTKNIGTSRTTLCLNLDVNFLLHHHRAN